MAIRRQQGRYVVEFQQSGVRVFRRLPAVATKGDAQELETRLRRDLLERRTLGRPDEPSLAAAIQLWLEETLADKKDQRKPRQNAALLAPYVKGRTLREAPDAAAEAVKTWRGELAPATINRRLAVLQAACHHAYRRGWIEINISAKVPRLREDNRREVYLTRAQVRRLMANAPSIQCRAAIALAAWTGLRASELLALGPQPKGTDRVAVVRSKNSRPRMVPVHRQAQAYLRLLPIGMSYRRLIGEFWEARNGAGLQHVRFHDLRHTAASWLINAGADLYVVGAILGHSQTQTTARYAHLADRTLHRAVRRIR